MGKHRMISCEKCSKSIRSDNMKKHMNSHGSVQLRVSGRFAGRAPLPEQGVPLPVDGAPLPVVPLSVMAPLSVAPLTVMAPLSEAPLVVVEDCPSTRQPRSRSPSLSLAPLHHMSRPFLSQ